MSSRLEEELNRIDSLDPSVFPQEEKDTMRAQIKRRFRNVTRLKDKMPAIAKEIYISELVGQMSDDVARLRRKVRES